MCVTLHSDTQKEEDAEEAGHGRVAHCCRFTGIAGVQGRRVQGSTDLHRVMVQVGLAAGISVRRNVCWRVRGGG